MDHRPDPARRAHVPAWFPRGVTLLHDPTLNKGTAFTDVERDALGLNGLLPPHVCSQDEQVARVLENFHRLPSALEKYIFMTSLHDRNEALFFRIVIDNPDEMMPIIYTPTVGPGVPEVRPHLPAAARPVRHGRRPRPRAQHPAQLAAPRRGDDRRHRRRAHPRPRRPRLQRHGHPGGQALAVHRLRRRAADAVPAGDAGRRHQQPGAARRPALPRPGAAAADRRRPTTSWSTNSSPPRARCSRAS